MAGNWQDFEIELWEHGQDFDIHLPVLCAPGSGASIKMNGVELPGVRSIEIRGAVDEATKVTVEFLAGPVQFKGKGLFEAKREGEE